MIELMVNVRTEFNDEAETEFIDLKKALGLAADTEVVRYAIKYCYKAIIGDSAKAEATQ